MTKLADFDTRDRADNRAFVAKAAHGDRIRFITRADGYVMVRKPRCIPFVLSENTWLAMPLFQKDTAHD